MEQRKVWQTHCCGCNAFGLLEIKGDPNSIECVQCRQVQETPKGATYMLIDWPQPVVPIGEAEAALQALLAAAKTLYELGGNVILSASDGFEAGGYFIGGCCEEHLTDTLIRDMEKDNMLACAVYRAVDVIHGKKRAAAYPGAIN